MRGWLSAGIVLAIVLLTVPTVSNGQCVLCILENPGPPALWGCTGGETGYTSCTTTVHSCSVGAECPGGGGCFLAGALVATPAGPVPIQTLEVGDEVVSQDNGVPVTSTVTRTYKSESSGYLIINGNLRVTDTHPFFVDGRWIQAGQLQEGSALRTQSGRIIPVHSIEPVDRGVRVYNIEVDRTHTFFVNGVLVHNKPPDIQ